MITDREIEDLLRTCAPQVLGVLMRRYGNLAECEDAVQEALVAAATGWPSAGVPEHPRSWLVSVARRRLADAVRGDIARRRREDTAARLAAASAPGPGDETPAEDDTLTLLLMCCHPALTMASQAALTLRAVGGLSTAEIARAYLVPETTMAQRISRAKQRIAAAGATFELPPEPDLTARVRVVLHVLYLIFNEGYSATSGDALQRLDLADEAIRLTRILTHLRPDEGEVAGLLALMLLTHARRHSRVGPHGELVPLSEQDRGGWDHAAVAEGSALISATLRRAPIGPYQVQAAIAAVHAETPDAATTDWRQILMLYELLEVLAPGPMVTLNRAVAVAETHGAPAGLELLSTLATDRRLAGHHRLPAVRAHLLERAGDRAAARAAYREAARMTTSLPERRYLESRAARLA